VRRAVFIALVVLSVVVIVVGVWLFRREEYPFQFTQAEVVSARVESLQGSPFVATLPAVAPELAGWVSSMERDSSDVPLDAVVRLVIELTGGRQLQLDVGPDVSEGSWIVGPLAGQPPIRIDTETDLYWYLRGVSDAMSGGTP
jgi:hypothetical protein